jgi:hypothetical protein
MFPRVCVVWFLVISTILVLLISGSYTHRWSHQRGLHPDQHWCVKVGEHVVLWVEISPDWLSQSDEERSEERMDKFVYDVYL